MSAGKRSGNYDLEEKRMKNLKILIVDDNRDFAESMADVLGLDGHVAEIAYSGEEAEDKFRENDYDIVFMDVKLPGKNGVESFHEIQKFKPEARIIMMTGYSVEALIKQAVKKGAWDILYKPVDMEKVLSMLQKIKPDGILIADDDQDFIEEVRRILIDNGYRVFTATNGKEAIEKIKAGGIDILILDLRMPFLNGFSTYIEMQKTGKIVPTIIVTAYSGEEEDSINQLKTLSVTGILHKPFDPEQLLNALSSLASNK